MSVNPPAAAGDRVRDRVREVVAGCLGLAAAEIDPRAPLALYGLDSLRSVELGAELEDAFRRPLPDDLLTDHASVDALVRLLEDSGQGAGACGDYREIDLMRSDAVLPFDIRPEASPGPARAAERVLLTGATGFLGAHLLGRLLAETGAEVLCLVRDSGSGDVAWCRVRRSLERYRLWDDAFAARMHTVTGDLSQPGLGLTPSGQRDDRVGRRRRLPRRRRRQLGLPVRRPSRRQRRCDAGAPATGVSGPAEGVPLHLESLGLPCRR